MSEEDGRLILIAASVAAAMANPWSVGTQESSDPEAVFLDGPHGARLLVRLHGWRLEVSGSMPPPHAPTQRRAHKITMAATKNPEMIAAEIRRRLLPDYLSDLAAANRADEHAAKATAIRLDLTRELAAALNGQITPADPNSPNRTSLTFTYHPPGRPAVSGYVDLDGAAESASMHLIGLTQDQLRNIVTALTHP